MARRRHSTIVARYAASGSGVSVETSDRGRSSAAPCVVGPVCSSAGRADRPNNRSCSSVPMDSAGAVRFTDPVSRVEVGICSNAAVVGSWTATTPPPSRIAVAPAAPSPPLPDRTTPTASGPNSEANDCSNRSMFGHGRFCGLGCGSRIESFATTMSEPGGPT